MKNKNDDVSDRYQWRVTCVQLPLGPIFLLSKPPSSAPEENYARSLTRNEHAPRCHREGTLTCPSPHILNLVTWTLRRHLSSEARDEVELRADAWRAAAARAGGGLRGHRPGDERRDQRALARVPGVRPLRRALPEGQGLRREVRRPAVRRLPLPLGPFHPLLCCSSVSSAPSLICSVWLLVKEKKV